jgi:hypothetical protein
MTGATTAVHALLFFAGAALAADRPEVPLWTGGAPGSEGKTAKELVEPPAQDHSYVRVTSVHKPSLTV